jgi:hypothetical protein
MAKITLLILLLICAVPAVLSQNLVIEGRILNKRTSEPVAFANVFNKSLANGTISNSDGYFRIKIAAPTDTVQITSIGFKPFNIELHTGLAFYAIELEENIQMLKEAIVSPGDDAYLYDVVQKCRKSNPLAHQKAKAYYELKSFVDSNQIELVEGYYTLDIDGYKLSALQMKAGRLALRQHDNRYFASLESSRAIMMLDLFNSSEYFPSNPLELAKNKLKQCYHLTLDNVYLEPTSDSIYVIHYTPKQSQGRFFEGTLWINKTTSQLIKISLICEQAVVHPFLPMFPSDSISKVSFNIIQSFKLLDNGQSVFNHTDFIYQVDYKSRIGKLEEEHFSVQTNALLYAYSFDELFFQPLFKFNDNALSDYRMINALPYNDFFWSNNDEYRLHDSVNTNELFFADSGTVTNRSLFKANEFATKGLFEHPYARWSERRIKLREVVADTIIINRSSDPKAVQYNLDVKLFVDLNTYSDSTSILTAAIFDPYESYYALPMDNKTHCFVNVYFDLCEIKRRALEAEIQAANWDPLLIQAIYDEYTRTLEGELNGYLKAVQRGTNLSEMRKYCGMVNEKLGIDNYAFFKLFDNEE